MEVKVIIRSKQLSKEDLISLLQSIRDCEQRVFPDKEIFILVEVPELSTEEPKQILTSVKPTFKYGPIVLKKHKGGKSAQN